MDIEIGIHGLKRIKRPLNKRDSTLTGLIPLCEFQVGTSSPLPVISSDGQRERVPVRHSIEYAGCRIHEPNKSIGIKCAQYHPPNMSLDNICAGGNQIDIGHSPDFTLQLNALLEFCDLRKRSDGHVVATSDFAFCQRASISSKGTWSSAFPCLANSPSMYWKRDLNLRFARFSADSESILR